LKDKGKLLFMARNVLILHLLKLLLNIIKTGCVCLLTEKQLAVRRTE